MTEWIGLHIYYASNANPLLLQCVGPLVARLREAGLIRRWFFIRYWVEGPHVRLRLLPSTGADAETVRSTALEELRAYLKRRPALYDAASADTGDLYHRMFVAEYGEEAWQEKYGDTGAMPFRPNNSVWEERYEPEYDRYGGPAGIELAERNFEASSDLVLRLLATTNTHVRTVLLGTSAQMTATMCYAFLGRDDRVVRFLENYRAFWENTYQEQSDAFHDRFDRSFEQVAELLRQHLSRLGGAAADPDTARLTSIERGWLQHSVEVRDEVVRLADAGQLVFRRGGPDAEPTIVTDHETAFTVLLSSYVHMTNNRLGASILDEIYLSYLMGRALEGAADPEAGPAGPEAGPADPGSRPPEESAARDDEVAAAAVA
ncbi:thiopeptide-type bacteriocin biosynthesis protein [Micromonospora sonneratiae]|uniref:Thiopeptide-type bacteriocin biosynthesis protein n=1 Tax=Micromonospora sonneratiae TaxID=1184706 RepID=A0ABW3Y834_9ACTN